MTDRANYTSHMYPFVSKLLLDNFKSVPKAEVGLAPLTLLVGENSSGKSTVLQALRLISLYFSLADPSRVSEGSGYLEFPSEEIESLLDTPTDQLSNMTNTDNRISIRAVVEFAINRSWSYEISGEPKLISWDHEIKNLSGMDPDWRSELDETDHDAPKIGSSFLASNIRDVGPMREGPETKQESGSTLASGDVGRRGQFTANVLKEQGSEAVGLPMPGGGLTKNDVLRSWVTNLGLVEDVRIADPPRTEVLLAVLRSAGLVEDVGTAGPPGPTIEVKPQGLDTFLPLSSVGVGVSQLLPVLVRCLLTEPGSVILLEQPEIHLHPAVQQRMADFFIAMVRSGRQLIVETHSEYMVSRLRRRIVEDPADELLDLAKVVFAERDRETGLSSYREVELSPYGAIEEWPAGFFDQAAEEERAIILGGVKKLRKRTAERQRSDA